ncbi:MAG: DUF3849 domain-containing protein, partial [Oscillospiraceae bacterium]|nr:DUF3849 domain-containing protein [Oscillospiraceae bacterium]
MRGSCYEPDYYNLSGAVMSVVNEYGFERVGRIIAAHIQRHNWDGRYSGVNKEWAREFEQQSERTPELS